MKKLMMVVAALFCAACQKASTQSAPSENATTGATLHGPVTLAKALKKDEFESTDDYRKRIAPLLAKTHATFTYLSWGPSLAYNADAKRLTIMLFERPGGYDKKVEKKTTERTAMNVEFEVEHGDSHFVTLDGKGAIQFPAAGVLTFSVPCEPDVAKSLRDASLPILEYEYTVAAPAQGPVVTVKEEPHFTPSLSEPWRGRENTYTLPVTIKAMRIRVDKDSPVIWEYTDAQAQAEIDAKKAQEAAAAAQRKAQAAAGAARQREEAAKIEAATWEIESRKALVNAVHARKTFSWSTVDREELEKVSAEFVRRCSKCAPAERCKAALDEIERSEQVGERLCPVKM